MNTFVERSLFAEYFPQQNAKPIDVEFLVSCQVNIVPILRWNMRYRSTTAVSSTHLEGILFPPG